jgi:formylmethanofuran dehydrogenase subunit C
MSGGQITIRGNAGSHVGRYMSGGVIDIEGQIGSISESCRGRIYHGETLLR